MKVLNFSECVKSGNDTYDFMQAIRKCKQEKYDKIVFPKSVYEIDTVYCEQRNLNVTNHGINGPKRIALLIEEMQGVEIDFCGSKIVTHGIINPVVIRNSRNVTLKNLYLDNPETMVMQTVVEDGEDDWIKVKICSGGEQFFVKNEMLYCAYNQEDLYVLLSSMIEFNGVTGEIERGTADNPIGHPLELKYEKTDDGYIIIRRVKRIPPIGNYILIRGYCRAGSGIFIENSEKIELKNVNVHACYGMGFVVQFSKDITFDSCGTRRIGNRMYTAGADATHFVGCQGDIKVRNCYFEGQFDDALNIHGMYLGVTHRLSNYKLLVKQMHYQATGLPIIGRGDELQAVSIFNHLPFAKKTVKDVEYLNDQIMEVEFEEEITDIPLGDLLENLTKTANLTFEKNIVKDNRARGLLLAGKGKTKIIDNYFHTAGIAIMFEAEIGWWFEAGATADVIISGNKFDNCQTSNGGWGNYVIEYVPRDETVEDEYFHGSVKITDNEFITNHGMLARFNNIREVVLDNNLIKNAAEPKVFVYHLGMITTQKGVKVLK